MDIWSILGISATADKKTIQAAYRAKLTETNPEDKPEEFKALRAAYEQALKLAKQVAEADGTAAQTEAERWTARLNAIYMDIAKRRDPDCWQALLGEDFCLSLATRSQARDALLRYLMQHYFLPQPVWRLLEEFFSLREHREELLEQFPRDFIENAVFAGTENDEVLPYGALEGPGAACDDYLRAYGRFRSVMNKGDADAMQKALAEMEATGVWHPYTLFCQARLALAADPGDLDRASELSARLNELLPGDLQTLMLAGDCAVRFEDHERADLIWAEVLERYPDVAQAKFNRVESLMALERYPEAKELSLQLHKKLPNNQVVQAQLHALNRLMIPQREQRLQDAPDDGDNIVELAWCYNQESRPADALRMLQLLPAQLLQGQYDYENLAAKVYLGNDLLDEALPHLRRWERAIRNLPDDEENAEKKARLPEAIRLQAAVCEQLGRDEDAGALYHLLEEQYPEDVGALQQRVQRALRLQEYDEAERCAALLTELTPHEAFNFYLLGRALFHQHRRQEAYNAFGETMQRAGHRDASCLMYQCRILMDVGQWEDAKKIRDDLAEAAINDPMMDYIQGRFAQHEARYGDAETLFARLVEQLRTGKAQYDFAGEVFYRLAGLRMDGDTPKEDLLALAEEGLRFDPDGMSLMEMKADLLRQLDRVPEAIDTLQHLLKLAPRHRYAHESLGRLYQYCQRDFTRAAACYEKQLELEETAGVRNLLGLALQELGRYDDARAAFGRAMELDPETAAYPANLAALHLLQNDWAAAEERYRQALALPNLKNRTKARLRRDLAQLYMRQERCPDAVRLLEENVEELHEYDDLLLQAEAHARSQALPAALAVLDRWRDLTNASEADYLHHKADHLLKNRQPRKALSALWRAAGNSMENLHLLTITYTSMGRYRTAAQLFRHILKLDPSREDDHGWYAKTLLWQGKEAQAIEWAQKGLELLEQNKNSLNRAMYATRKTVYLTLLNRLDEIEDWVGMAQTAPLCRFCSYGGCKDLLWAKGFLMERRGDHEAAERLYTEGVQRYPDEYDFIAGLERLKKARRRKRNH